MTAVEWQRVGSEIEALIREACLIRDLQPIVNVQRAAPRLGTRAISASLVRDVVLLLPSIDSDAVEILAARADGATLLQRTRRSGADLARHSRQLWGFFHEHARAAAEAISGALRSARSEAVLSNRSVAFTLDLAGRSYQWGQTPRQALSDDLRLALLTSRELLTTTGNFGTIRFDPDGGSSGGRVTIEGGGVTWWVGVDWLSGRVSTEENRS